jgi:heme/copper-type cytochrome/quinol oxidase subunit 3
MGTILYIATAVMLFGGFLSAYLVLRAGATSWPPPGQPRLPLTISTLNTAILLASGAFALRAVKGGVRSLRMAAILGGVFLVIQGLEWVRLLDFGLTVSSDSYGAVFYTIVGAHGLHVMGGLFFLTWTAASRSVSKERLHASTLYWGFVVLIWPILYGLLYLA